MKLTLADANRVIAGAIAKATEIGAKMNIAVCDAGGRLVAFQRMDGAMWAGSKPLRLPPSAVPAVI